MPSAMAARQNPVLLGLVKEDFSLTFWDHPGQPLPIYFGVHFVKLTSSTSDELGISSPNFFHQDGEPFTFAHLVYRSENMVGGVNFIAGPDVRNKHLEDVPAEKIFSQFTLTKQLDSFAVHDPRVSHYVLPIRKRDDRSAEICERCIILIDFSHTTQKI